jgi:hypothetical protein
MRNLKTYDEFLFEDGPIFGYDGSQLKVGKSVISFDGYSGIIVSKEVVNGRVQYRDHKGVVRVCESYELIEADAINEADLTWWEVAKGILAADAIKVGIGFAGGGLVLGAHLFVKWRESIANKIDKIRRETKYQFLKDEASKIADKFNNDDELKGKLEELAKYPYLDTTFIKGKREKAKADESNKTRKNLMREIAKYVKSKLSPDEQKFFTEVNAILRDKPLTNDKGKSLEEDVVSDPNRTVGTGTYTPVHHDTNPGVGGTWNNGDASSGGDTFFR